MVSLTKSAVGLLAIGAAVMVGFGGIGFYGGPLVAGIAVAIFAGLSYGVVRGDEFSVTFGLTVGGVIIAIYQLLPEAIATRLPLGTTLTAFDALTVITIIGAVILVWWVIDVRFLSTKAKKPGTVAKRVRKRTVNLIEAYATIGRVAFVGGIMAGTVVLGELGEGFGELGAIVADVPWIAADLGTAAMGFLAAGGELPVVGSLDISAALFAAFAITIIVAAAAADYA